MAFQQEAARLNIKSTFVTLIVSAMGFLVALQWRDVIRETIDRIVPAGEGLLYGYSVAIAITIGAVVVTYILMRLQRTNIIPDEMEERVKRTVREKVK